MFLLSRLSIVYQPWLTRRYFFLITPFPTSCLLLPMPFLSLTFCSFFHKCQPYSLSPFCCYALQQIIGKILWTRRRSLLINRLRAPVMFTAALSLFPDFEFNTSFFCLVIKFCPVLHQRRLHWPSAREHHEYRTANKQLTKL